MQLITSTDRAAGAADAEAARVYRRHRAARRRRVDSSDRSKTPPCRSSKRAPACATPTWIAAADPEMALRIVYNAKVRRPTICNALDTVLVHREHRGGLAAEDGGRVGRRRRSRCAPIPRRHESSRRPARRTCRRPPTTGAASFLSLVAAVRVVGSLDEALDHIRHVRLGTLRGDRHRRCQGRRTFPERSGCGGGVRERQHAIHRRRRVRLGRRGGDLHPEASRPRPDGAAAS